MSKTEARFRGSSREWRVITGQIHDLALGVAQNRTLAADLAQDVLKCLVQKGIEAVNVLAWARTALVRLHAKIVRRQARTEPIVEETTPSVAPDAEYRVQLKQTLALLPKRDRFLLTWSMEGAAQREMAERLGCSTAAIGTMLARARARARATEPSKLKECEKN